MFVLALLPMVVWLFLGSYHLAIHVKQASSARGELRRTPSKKLSEKGYEPRSDRGFGRCRETKMGGKVPFRCFVRLRRRLLRPFSDSFKAKFADLG